MPNNINAVVSQLRGSVQAALQARTSRIEVELPPAAEYGVETQEKRKRGSKVTLADVQQSERELARLFIGMFEGTGLVPEVLFPDRQQAAAACQIWGAEIEPHAKVRALTGVCADGAAANAPRTKSKSKTPKRGSSGGGGFGSPARPRGGPKRDTAIAAIPTDTEVTFVVNPGSLQLAAVREFCEDAGMDKLVILLNARRDAMEAELRFLDETFVQVYCFVPQATAPNEDPSVLWRCYPHEWVYARKPKLGAPRPLLQGDERPTADEMAAARGGGVAQEGGVLEVIGGLFR